MIKYIAPVSVLVLAALSSVVLSENTCGSGWFGSDCNYKCHCTGTNACDSDGECGQGKSCARGWFGPACQFVDLTDIGSVTRTSRQGNTLAPSRACLGATNLALVTVALNATYHLTWLRLIFVDPGFLDGVNVTFKTKSANSTCLSQSNSPFNNTTLDIHCPSGVTADQVILGGKGIKSLCSLFISGGRNIALKQSATSSSTFTDSTNHSADKAVDGDSSGQFVYCSCTNKTDSKPEWKLMFSRSHQIYRFDLYNRKNNRDRLRKFEISTFTNENILVFNKSEDSTRDLSVYTVTPDSLLQNVTKVRISSTIRYFTLCEVVIFGDVNCPIGTFGRDCDNTCNCAAKGEACFVSTGGCPSGCAAGFHGYGCNTPCPENFYGIDCVQPCSQNCSNKLCNSTSGKCFECIDGKQGDFCNEACRPGHYGKGCSQLCTQNCAGDGSCHETTGVCLKCKDGYKGDACNEKCQGPTFGAECLFTCSVNCTNQTCDYISGACYSCVPGVGGVFCDTEYVALPTKDNSTPLIVGLVVAVAVVLILALVVVALMYRRHRNASKPGHKQWHKQNEDVQVIFTDIQPATDDREEPLTEENEPKIVDATPYYNIHQCGTSMTIKVEDLRAFLLSHDAEFFKSQFEAVPNLNPRATTYVALSDRNKNKNRYKNICAYDHSRVCLLMNDGRQEDDYINASYVEGYKNKDKFIAAQGPNKAIVDDFVRMLWEQKIDKVVMLTHLVEEGKHKCEQYWPTSNTAMFDMIQIKLAATQVFADYTIRKLTLIKDGEPCHNVTHFHFTSWPDKGVPTTPWSLVDFEQRVFACPTTKPVVIHCSAGVGRTGTFIALHNVIMEAVETGHIDFYNALVRLRNDRMNMIQTAEQYTFLHKAAEVALLCLETTIPAADIASRIQFLETRVLDRTRMENEFNSICHAYTEDKYSTAEGEAEDSRGGLYENSRALVNKLKNRFSNILSNDRYRPHLIDIGGEKAGDYINAVLVPSFTKPSHQILTQLPLPTTITDFWRLVTQYKVSLIVAFEQDMKTIDSTIGHYLPSGETETLNSSLFIIKSEPATPGQFWLQQKLLITTVTVAKDLDKSALHKTEECQVTHLKCTSTDLDTINLLALVEKIRSHNSSDNGKTLFMCRNGATYSGLVYVLTLLLDRMDNDNHLTVPLVVGSIKAIRPQVIPTVEQYNVLYAVLNHYCDPESVYCNIGDSNPKPQIIQDQPIRNILTTNKSHIEDSFETDINVYANSMSQIINSDMN